MSSNQAKIGIETSYEDSDDIEVEFPWADDLGDNEYQIKNFPFFAYGVSFDDIVEARLKYDDDPYPYFVKVIEKSGHRTLRIILDESAKESEKSMQQLKAISDMGCGYEGTNGEKYFVINVQPRCDFDAVRDYLNVQNIQWEYGDPTYEQIRKENTIQVRQVCYVRFTHCAGRIKNAPLAKALGVRDWILKPVQY